MNEDVMSSNFYTVMKWRDKNCTEV